jgi:beta-lactam-binding protein with PASTA domain
MDHKDKRNDIGKRLQSFGEKLNSRTEDELNGLAHGDNKKVFRFIVGAAFAAMALMFATAGIVYFLKLQPKDETIVPKVTALPLTEALLTLQENNLTATIETRLSNRPEEEGLILSQSPRSGMYVKMGHSVQLTVSRGSAVNIIEDFTGMTLDQVRQRLITAYGGSLLQIEEPIVYVISEAPVGTVIAQSPLPHTDITGPTRIKLSVSRGNTPTNEQIQSYIGLTYMQALTLLSEAGVPFQFINAGRAEGYGIVTAQTPQSGHLAYGKPLILTVTEPAEKGQKVFGIAQFTLPDSPQPLPVRVVERSPTSGDYTLFSGILPSSVISLPYLTDRGNKIVLMIDKNEIANISVD